MGGTTADIGAGAGRRSAGALLRRGGRHAHQPAADRRALHRRRRRLDRHASTSSARSPSAPPVPAPTPGRPPTAGVAPRPPSRTHTSCSARFRRAQPGRRRAARPRASGAAVTSCGGRAARPRGRGGGRGDPAHRQRQHGQRASADDGRPRPRPAPLRAGRDRRRRPDACLRAGRRGRHPAGRGAPLPGRGRGARPARHRHPPRPAPKLAARRWPTSRRRSWTPSSQRLEAEAARAAGRLGRGHHRPSSSTYELDMRYRGQAYNLTVPFAGRPVTADDDRRGGAPASRTSTAASTTTRRGSPRPRSSRCGCARSPASPPIDWEQQPEVATAPTGSRRVTSTTAGGARSGRCVHRASAAAGHGDRAGDDRRAGGRHDRGPGGLARPRRGRRHAGAGAGGRR